jgi:uncharacterized membrane protein YdjX (TVP38/TMEM64 family)
MLVAEAAEKLNLKTRKIIIVLAGTAVISLFFFFDLQRVLTLDALKANRQNLLDYHAAHRAAMVAGFMTVYIVQTAFSLPGAALMSLAAGAIFGSLMGTVYAVIAAAIGATMAFLIARYLLRDLVAKRFGSRMEVINLELEKRGFNYLLFLRLVPVFPFFMINLAAGLTRLPLRTFFSATLLGIIPGGFAYVNAGASLATIESLSGVVSPRVLGSFALLGLLALVPALYSRYKGINAR